MEGYLGTGSGSFPAADGVYSHFGWAQLYIPVSILYDDGTSKSRLSRLAAELETLSPANVSDSYESEELLLKLFSESLSTSISEIKTKGGFRTVGKRFNGLLPAFASLCGSVGKDFIYHACGHESRLKWKFSNFPHHLWLLLSDYRGMAKWFEAHYNQEVRISSAVKCMKGPRSQLRCLLF